MKLVIMVYSGGVAGYTIYESNGRRMWSILLHTRDGSFWQLIHRFFYEYRAVGGTW